MAIIFSYKIQYCDALQMAKIPTLRDRSQHQLQPNFSIQLLKTNLISSIISCLQRPTTTIISVKVIHLNHPCIEQIVIKTAVLFQPTLILKLNP